MPFQHSSEHREVELRILERIKPKPEERREIEGRIGEFVELVRGVLRERGLDALVTIQGSFAHDTWLSGDRDVDVFVLFPEGWTDEELKGKGFDALLEAARRAGNYQLRYAQHPYIRVKLGELEIDLVPGFNIKSPDSIRTAVDRTPFHTNYLNSVLTDEMRNEIRLLKKFMKAIGVYGAEIRTRGFSGYAAELLVVHYKGFGKVLEAASEWRIPVFVDLLNKRELFNSLRRKYPDSCIYIPDPVDPQRNVTANVSTRSLSTFILAARCYLRSPSEDFFTRAPLHDIDLLREVNTRTFVIVEYELPSPLPPDVLWGEIFRIKGAVTNLLKTLGLDVYDASAWTDEGTYAVVILELAMPHLPRYKLYEGPGVDVEERSADFIKKHLASSHMTWIDEDGRLKSIALRAEVDPVEILSKRSNEYSVAPHFRSLTPKVSLLDERKLDELLRRGAREWIYEFITKTPHWMEKCIS